MNESERLGMKGLTRDNLKTVFDELFVFAEDGSLQDLVAAVRRIIEQRVTYMFHVGPYLVCASGFKPAFNNRNIPEVL